MVNNIAIQNLKCEGCEASILRALRTFPEVKKAEVDFETSTVTVESDPPGEVAEYELALSQIGYPPVGSDNPFFQKAQSYVSCAIGRMTT